MNKRKIGKKLLSFSVAVLETIKELGELIPEPFEDKQSYQRRLKRSLMGYPPVKIDNTVYRLEKEGMIKKRIRPGSFAYELTPKAQRKLKEKMLFQKAQPSKEESSIVIFDIPEEQARARLYLRRLLLRNGFISLQKSVLIAPIELPAGFYDFLEELKIRKFVSVIQGRIRYQ